MEQTGSCGRCGTEVANDAIFCRKCGLDVTQAYTPGADETAPATTVDTPDRTAETVVLSAGAILGSTPADPDATRASTHEGETVVTGPRPADGTPPPRVQMTMRDALADATVGEYEILSELGRGGMATVFLAHDIALDRKVAIKVMAPHLLEGEGMVDRFKLEARTAAQLSHPHIIPIYAVKWTDETIFFVMKFIEGRPLDDIIKKMAPLPMPMVKDILIKVGGALGYGHRREVVHRDIKPANIMIDEEGTPIVTDFGIAKVASEGGGLTMTGTTIGTPSYMSPEQCEAKDVSGASDQYSLGILAFEMLTGQLPFEGKTAVSTMYKHCHEPLPPLADFRPDCPADVRETVERMLAKDPADRWPSLEAAIQKLGTDSTMSYLDPVHSQLIELVKQGDHRELLARIQTPRSPIPVGRTGPTGAMTAEGAPPSRTGLKAAAVVVAVAVGAALAVLQPWAPAAGSDPVVTQPAAAAATPPNTDLGVDHDGPAVDETTTDPGSQTPVDETPTEVVESTPPADPTPQTPPPATPAAVARVDVTGGPGSMTVGQSAALTAVARDAGGNRLNRGTAQWASSAPSIVSVSNGQITALGSGTVTVTATIDGRQGSTQITVAEESIARIEMSPSSLALTEGDAPTPLSATAMTASNRTLATSFQWASGNDAVARVDVNGRVTPVGPGSTTVTASAGGQRASTAISVEAAPIDARTGATDVINRYARALESRDVAQVRAVYAGISPEQAEALSYMENLAVTLNIDSLTEQGPDAAIAEVSGRYDFEANGRQSAPVSFTAFFERRNGEWVLVRTQ